VAPSLKPVTIERVGNPERHVFRIQALNHMPEKGGQLVNTFYVVDTVYWGMTTSPSEWLDDAITVGKICKIPFEEITKEEIIDDGSFGEVYSEVTINKGLMFCNTVLTCKLYWYSKLKYSTLDHANIIPLYGINESLNFGLSKDVNSLPTSNARFFGATPYIEPQASIDSKYKKAKDQIFIIQKGARETPLPDTPYEYIELHQHCWKPEPKNRLLIQEVCSRLNYRPALAEIKDKFDDKLDFKLLAADLVNKVVKLALANTNNPKKFVNGYILYLKNNPGKSMRDITNAWKEESLAIRQLYHNTLLFSLICYQDESTQNPVLQFDHISSYQDKSAQNPQTSLLSQMLPSQSSPTGDISLHLKSTFVRYLMTIKDGKLQK
ncbi:1295_t:CDS:2, partial [Ambispora leptoticha]